MKIEKVEDFGAEARILTALKNEGVLKREDLQKFGIKDRSAREAILNLQLEGHPIINMQDGKGYKLAENAAELRAFKRQEIGRARKIIRKIYSMELEK